MIKHINPQNILISPFLTVKSRALSNTQNPDVVILERNGYPDGTAVALDYVDYNFGSPVINNDCNIALEQQESNIAAFQEGAIPTRTFNSQSDAQNADGTYKTLVYQTIKNAFYNTHNNPTQIFGVEHIDFPLSNTLRNLADDFRMFSLPSNIFGDKIQPNSVQFFDTSFDDTVSIFDDGYQNLLAGYNLFSRVQEIRTFPSGSHEQTVLSGSASFSCPTVAPIITLFPVSQINYTTPESIFWQLPDQNLFTASFTVHAKAGNGILGFQWYSGSTALSDTSRITGSYMITGSITGSTLRINALQYSDAGNYYVIVTDGDATTTTPIVTLTVLPNIISKSIQDSLLTENAALLFGSIQTQPPLVDGVATLGASLLSGQIINTIITSSAHSTASINMAFDSGYITNVIVPMYAGNDSGSAYMTFESGYITNILVPEYAGNDTSSVTVGFDSGFTTQVVITASISEVVETLGTFSVTLLTGSVA